MKNRVFPILAIVLSSFFTTGCWDRHELNQLSVVIGQGLDLNSDGTYLSSGEIAIPQALSLDGAQGKKYFVVEGTGRNIQESTQNMKAHLSRRWFAGHRQAMFISEQVARQKGMKDILDELTRNPAVRWRTDLFIVRHTTALEVMKSYYPFERLSGMADIKTHEELGLKADLSLRNFLIAASSETSCPTLADIQIIAEGSSDEPKPTRAIGSVAIFNKQLKLVGFISREEGLLRRWMKGDIKQYSVTSFIPEGTGYATIDLSHLKGHLTPSLIGGHIHMKVTLSGQGLIRENDTSLDLTKQKNVKVLETALDEENNRQVSKLIKEVQNKYHTDIFGFDQVALRKYPYYWKRQHLSSHWESTFSSIPISVETKLRIKRVGLTGPAAHLQEREVQS